MKRQCGSNKYGNKCNDLITEEITDSVTELTVSAENLLTPSNSGTGMWREDEKKQKYLIKDNKHRRKEPNISPWL